jgi:hypothetical protein
LVNGAPSFGVDSENLANSINSSVGQNIADYNNRMANRDTGGGFGGFLDSVISVATNPITWVAVAAAIVAPELAPAIGAELGFAAGSTAATAAGYGVIGAGTGAVTAAAQGANGTEIAKAALIGGATGAAGGAIGAEAKSLVPDLGAAGAAAVGGAAKGGIQAGLTGGSVGSSAAGGALGSALGTEIGGTTGNILGGAAGSATGAQLAGGDTTKSALYGGIQGAFSGLGKTIFNPQTGQQVAYNPMAGGDVIQGNYDPNIQQTSYTSPKASSPTYQQDYQSAIDAGYTPEQAAQYASQSNPLEVEIRGTNDLQLTDGATADYFGGGSKANKPFTGKLSPTDIAGKPTSTIDEKGTKEQNQSSSSEKLQLITPSIVSSSGSGGGSSPQVLSSVLGAPSSSILGQALQSSNPDPATTGNPVFEGDGKNQRNVWNTESLRTALGLS